MNKLSLESFYGGKQGVSPIVKARFKYIDINDAAYIIYVNKNGTNPPDSEVMEKCFANPTYEDVWYGQLAILDTENKRNPNNGKLFRRVLTRTKDEAAIDGGTLHGEYIGQIVGPASGYPNVRLNSIPNILSDIKNKWQEGLVDDLIYPTDEENIGTEENILSINDIALQEDNGKIAELIAKKTNNQLIPGAIKNEDGNWDYEKGIHYSWVNVKSDLDGEEENTFVYLGFQIPYTVLDFEFESLSWEKSFNAAFLNENDYLNGEQPFYQHWKIQIPRGITGNSIGYMRRTKFNEFENCNYNPELLTDKPILYKLDDAYFNSHGDIELPIDIETFEEENLKENTSILVYSFYMNYIDNNEQKTEIINCYLSKIKDIENIILENDGSFNIQYSDGEEIQTLNHLKWIKNIEYNKTNHVFIITYNDDTNYTSPIIHEIVNLRMQPTSAQDWNRFQILYTDATDENAYIDIPGSYFKYVDGLNINEDSGEIKYHMSPVNATLPSDINNYHSFGEEGFFINGIDRIYLGKDGHLYVKYSSIKFRPGPNVNEGETYTSSPYVPYVIDEFIDSNGKKWYRGGELPDAIVPEGVNEEDARLTWAWWLDLGYSFKTVGGLRIGGKFLTERYNAYQQRLQNDPEYKYDFDNASVGDILEILNTDWTLEGIDYNPYKNGHIYQYNIGDVTNLDAAPVGDNMGQIVYLNDDAYYYDFSGASTNPWIHAGTWSTSDDKMQIRIKNDENNTLTPSEILPHDRGFTFINAKTPINQTSAIPDIWETA